MTTPHSTPGHASPAVRRAWLIFGGLLTAALLAVGAFLTWSLLAGGGMSEQTGQASLSSGQTPETVAIDGAGADVELIGTQTDEATAELATSWYASERPAIEETWEDQTWSVDLGCRHQGVPLWFAPGCGITYDGTVPADSSVEVSLTSGAVSVENIGGAADLQTTSGSITAYDVSGDLTAEATSGSIRGIGLTSDNVTAQETSGSISLEFAEAPAQVRVSTTAGDIEVLIPRGQNYRVLSDTSSSVVSIEVATDPDAGSIIDLRTTSGNITVAYSD
ncbi:DUF4097 family beta strand repeat-containing protein [Nesterenkonia sp.]|uniref:DUF4097 family beta strand repeat-containing protein n=1 Tax=Nesterenkonia sp. TaxID=704201 RepID=UPI00262B2687|nr:DUF4097 family beta strand repeat-containing protein [Nesterenkonia sp.]